MHLRGLAFPLMFTALLCAEEAPTQAGQAFRELLETPIPRALYVPISEPEDNPKPDASASSERLIIYAQNTPVDTLDPYIQQRLLRVCEENPDRLMRLMPWLPRTPEAQARIKSLYDAMPEADDRQAYDKSDVKSWLMQNTHYFQEDLVQQVLSAEINADGSMECRARDALESLTRLDWPLAEKVLMDQERSTDAPRVTLALCVHYAHEMDANPLQASLLRGRLQRIAVDSKAAAWDRNDATWALLEKPWDGWEDWYLERLKDPSLCSLPIRNDSLCPLMAPLLKDPDRWVPFIIRRMDTQDMAIRNLAINGILLLESEKLKAEWLRPLLPWMLDPQWSHSLLREEFMVRLRMTEMPEAIPNAISILATSFDAGELAHGAAILARNPSASAIPFLRAILERPLESPIHEWNRNGFIQALYSCGGLCEQECLMAIQAVVAWKATHRPIDFRSIQKENLPLEVSIGRHLSANDDAQRQLALPLLKLTRSLEAKNPALAQELRKELWTWSVPEADQELMRRLTSCTPVLSDLTAAMTRRDSLVANHPSELAALAKGDGWRAALAAVLLNNQKRAEALLSQGDDGTRIALLASARMLRVPLNLGKVALLSLRSRDLAQAADAYLKAAKEF